MGMITEGVYTIRFFLRLNHKSVFFYAIYIICDILTMDNVCSKFNLAVVSNWNSFYFDEDIARGLHEKLVNCL